MKNILKIIILMVATIIISCAPLMYKAGTTPEMKKLYKPWQEIGFCLTRTGKIQNIQLGGWMTAPIPICNKSDIVMHTHPVWGEPMANFWDVYIWGEYKKVYGVKEYGVMKYRWYKVYEID